MLNDKSELPYGSDFVSDIQDYFEYIIKEHEAVISFNKTIQGVSQERPPKIFGHVSQYPNDLCKTSFTSFNLCSLKLLPGGN